MVKNKEVVKLSGVMILTLVLMLSVNIAIAGNPPPDGTHPAGPAVIAEITFEPDLDINEIVVGVAFEATGMCGGSPVIIESSTLEGEGLFDGVNKDSLLDFYIKFPTGLPLDPDSHMAADCIPRDKEGTIIADGMIVRAVTDFDEGDGTYKWASVILLFTVPK